MLTAVIPTLNRPEDLGKAVVSILNQTRPPNELIIIDQSIDVKSYERVKVLMAGENSIRLHYIHDPNIKGLVAAKKIAVNYAQGDIICFLEDDIVLEQDYIEQILLGFEKQKDMIGCCGIITNVPSQVFIYKYIFHIFHRGIYHDKRVGIYGEKEGKGHELVKSNMLSGGLSAWKRKVFEQVDFKPESGFFMLEDVDFSTRVVKKMGTHLYINPNARLEHNCSPINRDSLAPRHKRKVMEYILFYKDRQSWPNARISLYWLLFGVFIESVIKSIAVRSFWPITAYISGVREGNRKE